LIGAVPSNVAVPPPSRPDSKPDSSFDSKPSSGGVDNGPFGKNCPGSVYGVSLLHLKKSSPKLIL